jgi:chloramphenicol-sensitive protein RarD
VLWVIVAFVIGETIAAQEWPTYLAIWLSLSVLALEGTYKMRRQPMETCP